MKAENETKNRRKTRRSLMRYEIGRRLGMLNPFRKLFTKRRQGTIKRNQLIFIWSVLFLPLIAFLVFYVYVNIDALTMAFRNIDYAAGGEEYWTLENFKTIYEMFTKDGANSQMLRYGKNTFIFWLVAQFMALPYSILLTYAFQKKMKGHKFFKIMLYVPGMLCGAALAAVFSTSISGEGVFGKLLQIMFDLERVPVWFGEEEYAYWGLVFYNVYFGMAGSYMIYSGALNNVDQEVTEAAYMDGVTMWQELWYIDIPLMWPTLSMTIIGSFGGLFGASGNILLLTPHMEKTWTFGYWIYDQVRVYQAYYVPAALGLCFTLIAFPLARAAKNLVDRMFTTE